MNVFAHRNQKNNLFKTSMGLQFIYKLNHLVLLVNIDLRNFVSFLTKKRNFLLKKALYR